ncbi:MAG: hypothetical protein K1X79_04460 [Oligoflexia bacterium]|nr:hypothetical protein [Oligoflexia bacterium]
MRRSISEITHLVAEQRASGKSVPEFCSERGLPEKQFYVWRQRARATESRFARVQTDQRVELELNGGVTLRVAPEDLKVVLEALR